MVAIRSSGYANIYTIEKDTRTNKFKVCPKPTPVDAVSQCFPHGSYILDSTTGVECVASGSRYSDVLRGQPDSGDTYWVTAGKKGLRCSLNADGERLGRVDFGQKIGVVESAQVVHRHST